MPLNLANNPHSKMPMARGMCGVKSLKTKNCTIRMTVVANSGAIAIQKGAFAFVTF
ncbi:hypothetical protein D3C84_1007980 [compost metagenome]